MTEVLQNVLIICVLLQLKHMLGDFFVQTERMLAGRGAYVHLGRMQHAGVHGVLTFLAFLTVGVSFSLALVLGLLDLICHYHVDWLKGAFSDKTDKGPDTSVFWRAFGVDQLMHQLTYIGLLWLWLALTGG